jgi:hypothetical protein
MMQLVGGLGTLQSTPVVLPPVPRLKLDPPLLPPPALVPGPPPPTLERELVLLEPGGGAPPPLLAAHPASVIGTQARLKTKKKEFMRRIANTLG